LTPSESNCHPLRSCPITGKQKQSADITKILKKGWNRLQHKLLKYDDTQRHFNKI